MFGRVQMGVWVTGLALVLLGVQPAQAKDEFEDGFKDELGRIAAHEAVRGGRQILAGILLGGPQVAAAPAPYYRDEPAYQPERYTERVVYHEYRHDHYHHYPVAHGYYGRHDDSDSDSHRRHRGHKRHHHRGCHH